MREAGNLVLRIHKLDLSTRIRRFWKELTPPDPTVLIDIGSDPGQVRITPDGKSSAYTYWTFEGSSNPLVLAQVGTVTVTPTAGCVPGAGCGTARARFAARLAGRAAVTASRTTCPADSAVPRASRRLTRAASPPTLPVTSSAGSRWRWVSAG